ncbi:MAG: acylphosphatase [Lachnospiraceae bacterium]|nr:acylphosphatase [Lachnospiraceae bacterium]
MKTEKIRKHIIFHGRVQGVGFRYFATYKARQLGLTGWVRNRYDGTVEMEVQGTETDIRELIAFMNSQRWILIEDMETEPMDVIQESDFDEKW